MFSVISNQAKLAAAALAAALALTAFGSKDARAQNVHTFACDDGFGVVVDVRGLGNQNVCVDGVVDLELFCACTNRGGNCANDAKKQITPASVEASAALEPKNGRVRSSLDLVVPGPRDDDECAGLSCPGTQSAQLVGLETTSDATFRLCTTSALPGDECSCDTGELLASETCTAAGQRTFFDDTSEDCQALFP
jgi:hypothetical protein